MGILKTGVVVVLHKPVHWLFDSLNRKIWALEMAFGYKWSLIVLIELTLLEWCKLEVRKVSSELGIARCLLELTIWFRRVVLIIDKLKVLSKAFWVIEDNKWGACLTSTGPLNSMASTTASAQSLMLISSSSSTERMMGSTSSYSLRTHKKSLAKSSEYMNCLNGFPEPQIVNLVLFSKRCTDERSEPGEWFKRSRLCTCTISYVWQGRPCEWDQVIRGRLRCYNCRLVRRHSLVRRRYTWHHVDHNSPFIR